MSKSRLSNSGRKTRRTSTVKTAGKSVAKSASKAKPVNKSASKPDSECIRFAGISLSGGKSDKASVAILEYYPVQKKLFLARLIEKIKAEEYISADLKIHEMISQYKNSLELVAFDVPLSLPKCLVCEKKCPGYETCDEPEIVYIRNLYQGDVDKRKPRKIFTPYMQRCSEAYLAANWSDDLDIQPAMGANQAPLTARGLFINRRLHLPVIEVSPRVSVFVIGTQLKVNKTHLKVYRNSVGGEEARKIILESLSEKWGLFLYQQDQKSMIENLYSFEALISALTAYLSYAGKTVTKPSEFPKNEQWVEVPL